MTVRLLTAMTAETRRHIPMRLVMVAVLLWTASLPAQQSRECWDWSRLELPTDASHVYERRVQAADPNVRDPDGDTLHVGREHVTELGPVHAFNRHCLPHRMAKPSVGRCQRLRGLSLFPLRADRYLASIWLVGVPDRTRCLFDLSSVRQSPL